MREPGLYSLQRRRHKCLMRGRKDEGAMLWAVGPSEGTKGNEQKLQYRTFLQELGKTFPVSDLTLEEVSQRPCGAPCLEELNTRLDTVLNNLLWLILLDLSADRGQVQQQHPAMARSDRAGARAEQGKVLFRGSGSCSGDQRHVQWVRVLLRGSGSCSGGTRSCSAGSGSF